MNAKKQPVNCVVRLQAAVSGPELKTKLLRGITQHYEGVPDAVKAVVVLPDNMQPVLIKIFDYILKTMGLEFLKVPLDDQTPKQLSASLLIYKIEEMRSIIAECPEVFNPIIACAISAGIDIMRLAENDPRGDIQSIIQTFAPVIEQASSRGVEQAFRKREKNRQDRRKSGADARRKESAIATMKKLVPKHGQVRASEIVESRANKRHYDSGGKIEKVLPVKPGTIRRWYNARLDAEIRSRKGAADARLGCCPS